MQSSSWMLLLLMLVLLAQVQADRVACSVFLNVNCAALALPLLSSSAQEEIPKCLSVCLCCREPLQHLLEHSAHQSCFPLSFSTPPSLNLRVHLHRRCLLVSCLVLRDVSLLLLQEERDKQDTQRQDQSSKLRLRLRLRLPTLQTYTRTHAPSSRHGLEPRVSDDRLHQAGVPGRRHEY